MRSPCRIGDECPGGSASRHSMRLPGPNSVGTFVADDSPLPFGPRKRDQSGASAAARTWQVSPSAIIAHSAFIHVDRSLIGEV